MLYKMINENLYGFDDSGNVTHVSRLELISTKQTPPTTGMIEEFEIYNVHSELTDVYVEDISKLNSSVFVNVYSEFSLDLQLSTPTKFTLTDEFLDQVEPAERKLLEDVFTKSKNLSMDVDVYLVQTGKLDGGYDEISKNEDVYSIENISLNQYSIEIGNDFSIDDTAFMLTDINEGDELESIIEKQVQLMFESHSIVSVKSLYQDVDTYIKQEIEEISKRFDGIRASIDGGFKQGELEGYERTRKEANRQLSRIR